MTLSTRITELLGIEHPIIQGGMMWVGRAEPAAAVALGADAVTMGPRCCATGEASIKQFIIDNDERGTTLIFRKFKNTGRVARNSVSERVVEITRQPDSGFEDIRPLVSGAKGREALESGDLDAGLVWAGLVWAGQCRGLIHDLPTCADLLRTMMADAEAIITRRLAGFVRH